MRLLSPTDVRRLLTAHGIAPRKSAGQNFVVDPNTVRKVVRDAGVGQGDLVCEVGPGLGSLTVALRAAGALVLAVEIDAGLVRALGEVLGDDPGVRVVHGDALRVDLRAEVESARAAWGLAAGTACLVANLPYNVATPVLFRALDAAVFAHGFVMVQREVGQRWAANPGDPAYGAVSVKLRALAQVAVAGQVSRKAFYPVPNVDSVTVRVVPRPWDLPVPRDRLFALVEAGFAQRRKRLRNALGPAGVLPAQAEAALTRCGLSPGARAEELGLDQWVELARALES